MDRYRVRAGRHHARHWRVRGLRP